MRRPQNLLVEDEQSSDPFDRLYRRWADHAVDKQKSFPSRQMWDTIVLFLLQSKDPDRIRRYKWVETDGPDTLGSDAYELWSKVPGYTTNRAAPFSSRETFNAYIEANKGSMKQVMQGADLGERYDTIVVESAARRAQARRGQIGVLTIGCIAISFLVFMTLTTLLIIGLKLL